jgi:hypothetical protein
MSYLVFVTFDLKNASRLLIPIDLLTCGDFL